MTQLDRRGVLSLAAASAAGVVLGAPSPAMADPTAATMSDRIAPTASPDKARTLVTRTYEQQTARAAGMWNALISVADADGSLGYAVDDSADDIVEAYSVNKIAVAVAVLDKIDRGLLTLDQRIEVPESL